VSENPQGRRPRTHTNRGTLPGLLSGSFPGVPGRTNPRLKIFGRLAARSSQWSRSSGVRSSSASGKAAFGSGLPLTSFSDFGTEGRATCATRERVLAAWRAEAWLRKWGRAGHRRQPWRARTGLNTGWCRCPLWSRDGTLQPHPRDRRTGQSTAASAPRERDPQARIHKTEHPALPASAPSSRSSSPTQRKIESGFRRSRNQSFQQNTP
jgi:hypothetical protein